VFRGTIDVPLNDQGFAEARRVGESLESEPVSFIYTSPLARAVQTAQPLADSTKTEIRNCDGFTDMNFGDWQGRKLEEIQAEEPETFGAWMESPQDCIIPNGETLAQVQRRALDSWWEITGKHPGETGMVVTHRVVCKLLILGLMGLGPEKFWNLRQDTANINLFAMESGTTVLHRINDTCHLATLSEGRVTADF